MNTVGDVEKLSSPAWTKQAFGIKNIGPCRNDGHDAFHQNAVVIYDERICSARQIRDKAGRYDELDSVAAYSLKSTGSPVDGHRHAA